MAFIAASRLDAILEDTTLTHSQKMMLVVLLRHGGNSGIYPSLRRIAKLSSLALSTVCTLMTELTSIGRVTVHHGQAPKGGNLYELHLPGVPTTGAPTTGAPVVGAPLAGAPATGAPATGTEVQTEE